MCPMTSSPVLDSIFEIAPPSTLTLKKKKKSKVTSRLLPPLPTSSVQETHPGFFSKYPPLPTWPTLVWPPTCFPFDEGRDGDTEEADEALNLPMLLHLYMESLIQSLVYEEACQVYQHQQGLIHGFHALFTEWLTEDVSQLAYTVYHRHVLQVLHTEKLAFQPWVYSSNLTTSHHPTPSSLPWTPWSPPVPPCPVVCALGIDAWIQVTPCQSVLDALMVDAWMRYPWEEEEEEG
ncbi:hypothetical protein HMI54_011048 [Coelomomyces lativittatus]|nr:hypothetical protein HMI56_000211 [Coelomomyces lativittatus]KAJ1514169.1 hypothetical protein HMI55_004903 [Coelomomyces lativittatus]KAJ1516045.1 hypothetical protein HMI54_011048 [Coelomomyces lativittatus]